MIQNEVTCFDLLKDQYKDDKDFKVIWKACINQEHLEDYILQEEYLFKGNMVYILKTSLGEILLRRHHYKGLATNLGRDKIIVAIKEKCYWPRLKRDTTKFI